MVHDHMMYFGDKALVRLHLPAIDRILSFFDSHLMENGLVGKIGAPINYMPVYLNGKWIKLDARGNRDDIKAAAAACGLFSTRFTSTFAPVS